MLFSVLTGFLAICTAIAQSLKEKSDSKERLIDKNEIIKLQQQNYDKLDSINNLQTKIINSNSKLIEANERIEALNIEQMHYQIGGDSFPYISIISMLDENEEEVFQFHLTKSGKYPLSNVFIEYWFVDEIKKLSRTDRRATLESMSKHYSEKLGDIESNMSFGNYFKIQKDGIVKINISITAKNGKFSELLRIHKSGKEISQAYKVSSSITGNLKSKKLIEHIDKSFPLTIKEDKDWNKE